MIAEAVDAAITVGWALLVWIVLLAVAATCALYTLVVGVADRAADGASRDAPPDALSVRLAAEEAGERPRVRRDAHGAP